MINNILKKMIKTLAKIFGITNVFLYLSLEILEISFESSYCLKKSSAAEFFFALREFFKKEMLKKIIKNKKKNPQKYQFNNQNTKHKKIIVKTEHIRGRQILL